MGPTNFSTGIEVRRISRAVNSADYLASHNSSQDLCRAVVQMGGMWLGAQLDNYAGFSRSSGALNAVRLGYACLFWSFHLSRDPGTPSQVRTQWWLINLSEVVSIPDGNERKLTRVFVTPTSLSGTCARECCLSTLSCRSRLVCWTALRPQKFGLTCLCIG